MTHRQMLAISLAALISGMLACGPATSGGGAPPEEATEPPAGAATTSPLDIIEPCAVLTQEDAAAFFGTEAQAGEAGSGSTNASCRYMSSDGRMNLYLLLEYDPAGALNTADYVQQKTADAQDVAGLGDGAYFDPANHMLQIAKGSWMVRLNGWLGDSNAGLDKLQPLAPNVLGRLP